MSKQLLKEIERRRTFGIISHPDAGKTTLTEKLLLFGGAIQLAGAVKARKASRHALSDWMSIEKERGISVTSSVMKFDYADCEINLLDTPGHQDFSEDTYRVLTAVDSALMVIDGAKGVETQTQKLAELEQQFQAEVAELQAPLQPADFIIEEVPVRPRKSDITIPAFGLAWTPWAVASDGTAQPLFEG